MNVKDVQSFNTIINLSGEKEKLACLKYLINYYSQNEFIYLHSNII